MATRTFGCPKNFLVNLLKGIKLSNKRQIVGIVFDGSSSMAQLWSETLAAANEQLGALRETDEGFNTSLVFTDFSTTVKNPQVYLDINNAPNIPTDKELPGGMTALYDAVMRTLDQMNALEGASDPETNFFLTIYTDGHENNSSRSSIDLLPSRLKELKASDKWVITYVGTKHDLSTAVHQMNLSLGNTLSYTPTSGGVRKMSGTMRKATVGYRDAVYKGVAFDTESIIGKDANTITEIDDSDSDGEEANS